VQASAAVVVWLQDGLAAFHANSAAAGMMRQQHVPVPRQMTLQTTMMMMTPPWHYQLMTTPSMTTTTTMLLPTAQPQLHQHVSWLLLPSAPALP
jgi:hypothetical protein